LEDLREGEQGIDYRGGRVRVGDEGV